MQARNTSAVMNTFYTAILCLGNLVTVAQSKPVDLTELKKLYHDYYLSSSIDSIGWTNNGECDAGIIPNSIYEKVEKRINFFRLMNRLPTIKVNTDKQFEAQSAAFLTFKNNDLNHHPSKEWTCYSAETVDGALHSCLSLNNYASMPDEEFITGFVEDLGDDNYCVGHRRWILYSKAETYSYGATNNSEALYSNESKNNDALCQYIAYPWNGYVPCSLVFSKWSFSIPESHKVNFSKLKIKIFDKKGKQIPFKLYPQCNEYPDKTISWRMTSMFSKGDDQDLENSLVGKGFINTEISVNILNVIIDNKRKSYHYKVKIVDLDEL